MSGPARRRRIRRSLTLSWQEGIPASAMLGAIEYYLVPYGLFLGATTPQIGWLVALPQLLGSCSQLLASRAVALAGSRLRFIVGTAGAQAALLLPTALIGLLAWPGRVGLLIGLAIAFRVFHHLHSTAWGSLMSDYLFARQRGRYFGWRSQIVGIAQLAGIAAAGLTLAAAKGRSLAWGFGLVFLGASGCRLVSALLLARMHDIPRPPAPGSEFTFLMFLRRVRESNFVRFTLYVAGLTFTTNLASPYFSVYMLRDVQFGYLTYTILHLAAVAASLLAFPVWGRHADLVGNARVLKMTGGLIPVLPLLWLVSPAPLYLALVQVLAGFLWGGFNLCATNFVYDAVTPAKRVRCLGYFSLLNGVALCAGASLGGVLAEWLPPFHGHRLLTLFALSGLLRIAVNAGLAWRFQEVRQAAARVSSRQLFFSVVGWRPLAAQGPERE